MKTSIISVLTAALLLAEGPVRADLAAWSGVGAEISRGKLGTFDGTVLYFESRSRPFDSDHSEYLVLIRTSMEPIQEKFFVHRIKDGYEILDPDDYSKKIVIPSVAP